MIRLPQDGILYHGSYTEVSYIFVRSERYADMP